MSKSSAVCECWLCLRRGSVHNRKRDGWAPFANGWICRRCYVRRYTTEALTFANARRGMWSPAGKPFAYRPSDRMEERAVQ